MTPVIITRMILLFASIIVSSYTEPDYIPSRDINFNSNRSWSFNFSVHRASPLRGSSREMDGEDDADNPRARLSRPGAIRREVRREKRRHHDKIVKIRTCVATL